ncbi:MAG: flagellar motor protein MotB [Paracoccaceae bacterium]
MSDQPAPIIIKRKKIIAGGHHGGAWKVAYADFVTAMMAFFLLMWLLGATTEKQRKGIADYFNPTIPVNKVSGGGSGAFGGDSVFTENTLAQNGTGAGLISEASEADESQDSTASSGEKDGEDGKKAADPMEELEKKLTGRAGESMVSDLLQRHIITQLTDEGLIVEVFDIPGVPLFLGQTEPSEELSAILGSVAEVFRLARNPIAVQGHVATVPLAARDNPVWELSAARADQARQILERKGLQTMRMQRVTGFADRSPAVTDTLAERNNRLEIILLRDNL